MTAPRGTAIVTGAGRGIGRAIATRLAEDGWDIGLLGRTIDDLETTAVTVRATGQRASVATVDVRARTDVVDAVRTVESRLGPVDVLVNNAGVQRLSPAIDVDEEDWDSVLDTNLKGAFLCMQAVGRSMLERRHGSIVNIASVAGLVAVADRAAYAASKAGLLMLTRVCAVEWATAGVRVNAVAPTFVETELGLQTLDQPGMRSRITERIPMGRLAGPDDVVGAVRFLLDDDSAGFVTGEVITVDGGLRA
jgi:NAD(P)-dependent dehydrogenase (short-subunit alcohol dehydrogenase family)